MTENNDIRRLKIIAKRYARANMIAQHRSLDLIAGQLGFPNWVKLLAAGKTGWLVKPEKMAKVEAFSAAMPTTSPGYQGAAEAMAGRFTHLENADAGMIGEHPYRLHDILNDTVLSGDGWSIRVPENPGAAPIVENYSADGVSCPVLDREFLNAALEVARSRAARVRRGIATDWPRRSTKPDLDGIVRHPLSGRESPIWFCYHCDGKITGAQMAENLWHCPGCGASPLDIYDSAFWVEDQGRSFPPIRRKQLDDENASHPKVGDGRPKLELNAANITLLMRSALIDDATNVSERLGALHAEISVDEDRDVWITLDTDLWPEEKDPVEALAVAALLGIEVEVECTAFTIPFAWPGLGEFASGTADYTRMMFETYAQYRSVPESRSKMPPPCEDLEGSAKPPLDD